MMAQKTPLKIHIVTIEKTPIELCQLLKFANLVQSGGEAKAVIAAGLVRVNGAVETRKRKKLTPGDMIEFEGEKIKIKENQA